MKKLSTLAVLAAAVVSVLAVVGSAQAANWNVSPSTNPGSPFTASAGAVTLKIQGKTTSCSFATASGNLTANTLGPVFTLPWGGLAVVTPAFSNCTNAGVNYNVVCAAATVNATAGGYNGGTTTSEAASAGLATVGSITSILCTIKPTATPSNNCTTVTGTVPVTYTNPASLAAGGGAANQGSLVVSVAGQSLTGASVGGCIAAIGTGTATFSALTYSVSGSPVATVAAPHIWAQ
ncbi:MAG: hypothetical protein JWQ20_272 [Conexibacter sp.]|nr:hypothetical protein [Conexibacter sp.]